MLSRMLVLVVRVYQAALRPLLPPACRFHPTCSDYMIEAIRKKGALRGICRGAWRILRCNPFCAGGFDPVDPKARRPAPEAVPAESETRP
jgi:putative membrane protein insertion efficiency factor